LEHFVEYNLLEKRELWVTGLKLDQVNLTTFAEVAARVLNLPTSDVLVVDVRGDTVTLDILRRSVLAEHIAGKQSELLRALAEVPGVTVTGQAAIHSEGVLGMIALEPEEAGEMLERSRKMSDEIQAAVARRVLIFPSGFEIRQGLIEDTNSPYLRDALEAHGFRTQIGPILEDDRQQVAGALQDAISRGYGLVITTGGVGAEDKDHSVEALLQVDPQAATAWLVRYEVGQGRHVKPGVRVAVGQVGLTTLVTLPGPNDEVRVACPVLLKHLEAGRPDPRALVEDLAAALRSILAEKMKHHHHH
jgi:molybdenum cofactor synthesis domain-containing protein